MMKRRYPIDELADAETGMVVSDARSAFPGVPKTLELVLGPGRIAWSWAR